MPHLPTARHVTIKRRGSALTGKIFFKLISAVLCFLMVALFALDFLPYRVSESAYMETFQRELTGKARMMALSLSGGVELSSNPVVREFAAASRGRVTLIARDGRVLSDSDAAPEKMENHAHRPEVVAAIHGKTGVARRLSATTKVDTLYLAVAVPEGALRLGVPLADIEGQVNVIRRRMLASTAIAVIPAMLVALLFARFIARRLGSIIEYSTQFAQGNFQA